MWLCKMDRRKRRCGGTHTISCKMRLTRASSVHKNVHPCRIICQLTATHWAITKSLCHLDTFTSLKHLLSSTSAGRQRAADGTPATAPQPALGTNGQYQLLREWITLVSHCFGNCSSASCAIKPKQNNCQRLLHLCTRAVFTQLKMAACQSQILL